MSEIAEFLINLMSAGEHNEQVPDINRTRWMSEKLKKNGCDCDFQIFQDTANVYAVIGDKNATKTLAFCGHCDVVPAQNWTKNPNGEIVEKNINNKKMKKVYGRGAVDMLGGVASWYCALKSIDRNKLKNVKITTILTGDEEGAGTHGTKEMVDYLDKKGIKIDACIVGEPTSDYKKQSTENIDDNKLNGVCYGRGGSFHFWIKVKGKSGHIAYVGEFDNPITRAVKICNALKKIKFNELTNLEISDFEAKNNTANVILDDVLFRGNIRFSNIKPEKIKEKIVKICEKYAKDKYDLQIEVARNGYLTKKNDKFLQLVFQEMKKYNKNAELTFTRGCTDGEYMVKIAKSVCELGLKCKMMHQIDEYTTEQDLEDLKQLYTNIINKYIEINNR